jgi:hypothetical protein
MRTLFATLQKPQTDRLTFAPRNWCTHITRDERHTDTRDYGLTAQVRMSHSCDSSEAFLRLE